MNMATRAGTRASPAAEAWGLIHELFMAQKGFKNVYEQELAGVRKENSLLMEKVKHLDAKVEDYRKKAAGFGGLERFRTEVQTHFGFARCVIRPVALIAVLAQDGTNVAIKING